MIGVLLHLAATGLDDAREAARDLAWVATFAAGAARLGLAAALDPEAARAVGEVARLRAERDQARARVAEETALAVSICWDLEACAADLEALRALVRAYKMAEDSYYEAKVDARVDARAALARAAEALFAAAGVAS